MTPAVKALEKAGIQHQVHRYKAGSESELGWGEEAAVALGIQPEQVFKTLVVELSGADSTHAVAVLPVDRKLDLRAASSALGAKRIKMADPGDAQRLTGYVTGGISPFGQRRRLPMLLDASAAGFSAIHVSGGRRGLEIEIAPDDFTRVTGALSTPISTKLRS